MTATGNAAPAGDPITINNGALQVPDRPVIPYVEGDGTGPDIWRASVRVFDAAVERAYGGKRKLMWQEVLAGEKAFKTTGDWLPQATVAKVLKALAHAGLVTAARGPTGGYRLARTATAISIAEVVAAIDGDIGLTQCSVHVDDCARTTYCPTKPHWAAINRAVGQALAAVSLDAMLTPAAFIPRAFASPNPSQSDEPRYSA